METSFKFVKQKPLEEIDGYCIREDGNIFSAKTGIIIKKHIKNGKEYAWVGCRENKHYFCIPALLEKYFPKEIPEGFVDIKGYEGLYYVNKEGKIYSKARGVNNSKISKYITPVTIAGGYKAVQLTKDGKSTMCRIHRIVAEAFIPNPNNLPEVNHKDENKNHKYVENLEWCSGEYNRSYGTRGERISISNSKVRIEITDVITNEIKTFENAKKAGEYLGVSRSWIRNSIECNKLIKDRYKGRYVR